VTDEKGKALNNGVLADVAPTILQIMGIAQPAPSTQQIPLHCAKSQQNFFTKISKLTIVSSICIIVENRQLYGFIYNIHKVRKVYKLYG